MTHARKRWRAQLLYAVRSERLLMEEMDYNILFRWFVGLNLDDQVWDSTVFAKNRHRLLKAEVAQVFLERVVGQARAKEWTSDEHVTGTVQHRRVFWLLEGDCLATQGAPSWNVKGGLDLCLRLRGLQPGAYSKSNAQHSSGTETQGRRVFQRCGNATVGLWQRGQPRESPLATHDERKPGQKLLAQLNLPVPC